MSGSTSATSAAARLGPFSVDTNRTPITVAWEITRACPLHCQHCRADAQHRRHPDELTTEEGIQLIGQVAEMGTPVLVITGGDPLARPDVFDLIASSASAGLHTGLSPSVTPRLTEDALARAVDAGAGSIHLSLDGSVAATHDHFRGFNGAFERTLAAMESAARLDARLQIGTTVTRETVDELADMVALLEGKVDLWSLFVCVPTGRADKSMLVDPDEYEELLHWLASGDFPFPVRTIAAPALRRVLAQQDRPVPPPVNDGRGFCFVSHIGEVCPSGFLQEPVGNVRDADLASWYRDAPLFKKLRSPELLNGKCGVCEYRDSCGGSRARAWALTGDPLADDPLCGYVPVGLSSAQ